MVMQDSEVSVESSYRSIPVCCVVTFYCHGIVGFRNDVCTNGNTPLRETRYITLCIVGCICKIFVGVLLNWFRPNVCVVPLRILFHCKWRCKIITTYIFIPWRTWHDTKQMVGGFGSISTSARLRKDVTLSQNHGWTLPVYKQYKFSIQPCAWTYLLMLSCHYYHC